MRRGRELSRFLCNRSQRATALWRKNPRLAADIPPATRVSTTRVDSSLRKNSVNGQTKSGDAGRRQPRKTIEREGHDIFPCAGFNLLELVGQNCRRGIEKT